MLFSQWVVCRAFKKLGKRELELFQASSDVDIPHFITDFPKLCRGHFLYSLAWNSQVFVYAQVYEDPYHLFTLSFLLLHAFYNLTDALLNQIFICDDICNRTLKYVVPFDCMYSTFKISFWQILLNGESHLTK